MGQLRLCIRVQQQKRCHELVGKITINNVSVGCKEFMILRRLSVMQLAS